MVWEDDEGFRKEGVRKGWERGWVEEERSC